MNRLSAFAFAFVLAAGCSKKADDTKPPEKHGPTMAEHGSGATMAGSGSGSAAPLVIKPYTPAADVPDPIKAAIAATDRSDKDRALDAGRKPGEVFAFFKLAPGQKVGELFAGPGASTELIARIVGDTGHVYAQNTKEMLDKFARGPLTERLAKPVMKNTQSIESANETPFPPEVKDLDAVVCILNYHDYVWQNVDRAKMNAAVFAALKSGGTYDIVQERPARRQDAAPHRRGQRQGRDHQGGLQARRLERGPQEPRRQARLEQLARRGRRAPRHERSLRPALREAVAPTATRISCAEARRA